MSDHRRLQRTLFRMQLDPVFARSLRAGEPGAVASTGLVAEDLALLTEASPAGVEADFGGRRRTQFLGNVASEFLLTTWVAVQEAADPDLVESFPSSEGFHRAAAENGRFPLAFAAHASRRAAASAQGALVALCALESAMARARRELVDRPEPGPGEWVLAPTARLLRLPLGTLDLAAELRRALDEGRSPALPSLPEDGGEVLLLHALSAPTSWRRAEVQVESLGELSAALLTLAERPLGPEARARFRVEHDVAEDELEDFAGGLANEGLLLVR